jgi:hypothetical protein
MSLERDFIKYTGGPVIATRDRLHATLSALGVIYINKRTYEVWGRPVSVALYYSAEKETIAIEHAHPRSPESFPVKQCQNGYRILAGPFLGHFNIRTQNTVRFTRPDIEGGLMLLNLRDTVNVTERRHLHKPAPK